MFDQLTKLSKVANKTFPVTDPDFKGSHSVILSKLGLPSLLIWYQHSKKSRVRAYRITLDGFEWENIELEFKKMKKRIVEQEKAARAIKL